jgi:hypothetical protein
MFCSDSSDLIEREIKCVECLCENGRCVYEIDGERMRITMLFRNASAKCFVPTTPISLKERSSVVSVCVKREDAYMR